MSAELFTTEATQLRCIGLWQPWAWWVIKGWKTIETRRHSRFACLANERIGIHATKRWDVDALDIARKYLSPQQKQETLEYFRQRVGGVVLGTVQVHHCDWLWPMYAENALIECDTKRFGLFLSHHVAFEKPIPAKGLQGIFKIPMPCPKNSLTA